MFINSTNINKTNSHGSHLIWIWWAQKDDDIWH